MFPGRYFPLRYFPKRYFPKVGAAAAVVSAVSRQSFFVRIFDANGNLARVLDRAADPTWEYNRNGGCGQCALRVYEPFDLAPTAYEPRASVGIYVDEELRYLGEIVQHKVRFKDGQEFLELLFYGYVARLSKIVVARQYQNKEVSVIIKDILDQDVLPVSPITYVSADVEGTDYVVQDVTFNHTAMDAISFLVGLAADFEWGVDRNKKFFLKRVDEVSRRVYVVGRDVKSFEDMRDDEEVRNIMRVFGADSVTPLATIQSSISVDIFGHRKENLFESSISEVSDATRYGLVKLRKRSNIQRAVKFKAVKPDEFVEETVPLGAATLQKASFRALEKYSDFKYGKSKKYGNLRRDQIQNVVYRLAAGGMEVDVVLSGDVPNLADDQKRTEFEIRDLQRR